MPPKRKSAVANGTSSRSSKRSKKGDAVDSSEFNLQWEWEADGGKWTAFADDLSDATTKALNNGEDEVSLSVGPQATKIKLILSRMVQKNVITGWERRIRVALKEDGEKADLCYWEWQDENGRWNPYNASCSVKIALAEKEKSKAVSLEVMGRKYTLDLAKSVQTNDDTGVERQIRSQKSACISEKISKNIKVNNDDEATKSTGKGKAKSAGKKGKSGGASNNVVEEESTIKTVVVKGLAPVDPECTAKAGVARVFTEGKDVYDVMLNQTNIQSNNNKYFVIQLLEDDGKKSYSVWFRWGRVGLKGQNNLVPCGANLDEAKKIFCKKFSDKTKNDWSNRKSFTKVAGKYDILEMDYGAKGNNSASVDATDSVDSGISVPDSKLDERLQDLIKLICDVKSMEDAVIEMKYDAKKAPLGKLTSQQIKAGYAALKIIDECVANNTFGSKHLQACNDFYTRIPHYFGMRTPPMIKTKADVKAKLNLLEALDDIEVAMNILKRSSSNENPVDTHYSGLDIELDPLDQSDADFKLIEDYVKNTHASTHNQYTMKVMDVFNVDKEKETKNYNDVGNRMLLWHGSRLTNWMGILSQGLRIAPPEAPVTGYMFGKGVYFADMSSKSANYCFASRSKNVGLLLLCEVALGNVNELLNADYNADRLPKGMQSVKGMGRIAPDSKATFTTKDGVKVPIGKPIDTKVVNPKGYTLNYNEFIVYDVKQIKMKYLVKVKFNFK